MKKRALLLSFIGTTVLTLGLQSHQAFANTYRSGGNGYYSYRQSNRKRTPYYRDYYYYYNTKCDEVITVPRPEIIPTPEPELKPNPAPQPTPEPELKPDPAPQPEVDVSVNNFEIRVIELTNVERAKQGLPALQIDHGLSKVARMKSQDMQDRNYFDHNSPTYGSPFDMMRQFGISYRSAGENIAKGQRTPEEVVNAWMNSEGHRKNILGNYTHIGVGYISSGNVWTQMFISK